MTKVHVDDLINCHVVDCKKLAINQFVTKFYQKNILLALGA